MRECERPEETTYGTKRKEQNQKPTVLTNLNRVTE